MAQRAKLLALMRRARGTVFAREHGLESVRTLDDYQDAVPVRDYDALSPWLDRMVAGEAGVLTREPILVFEPSSGSSAATKLLPYTRSLLDEFSAATGPWLYDLLSGRPRLRRASSYWSISPAGRRDRLTPGGDRIGFQDDTEYFPAAVRHLLRVLLPVPPEVARIDDLATCRYVTLRYLLADRSLGLLSVWNPSFLTLLLEYGRAHADRLADDVRDGAIRPPGVYLSAELGLIPTAPDPAQAANLRAAFPPSGRLRLERVWPTLSLVSCWTEGSARLQLPGLRRLLPQGLEVQGKGLLATEGVVSFPLLDREGAVLAVGSHVLELLPLDDPDRRPVAPHRADLGGRYQPILSTSGGLYRYPLGDSIEVVGRFHQTPTVRFLGRIDGVSDLSGEKLSPARVDVVLQSVLEPVGPVIFSLLTPSRGEPPGYVLYLESGLSLSAQEAVVTAVEGALREGHHYDYCRKLGQLAPLRLCAVTRGVARYEQALTARGMRAGNVKPPGLHLGLFWDEVFSDGDLVEGKTPQAALRESER